MVTRGDAVGQCVRRNILVDNRTGTDHGIPPHGDFRANRDTATDADVFFDPRSSHGSSATHGVLVIQKCRARSDKHHVADRGGAGDIDVGHDLHTVSNAKAAFQRTLVVYDAPVADRDLGTDQYLMTALEAMADRGVGVDDRPGTNDGVMADPEWI